MSQSRTLLANIKAQREAEKMEDAVRLEAQHAAKAPARSEAEQEHGGKSASAQPRDYSKGRAVSAAKKPGRPKSNEVEPTVRRAWQITERNDRALRIYAQAHKDEGDMSAIVNNALAKYFGKVCLEKAEAVLKIERGE